MILWQGFINDAKSKSMNSDEKIQFHGESGNKPAMIKTWGADPYLALQNLFVIYSAQLRHIEMSEIKTELFQKQILLY